MKPVDIAVGFFDGIHLGHQKIFSAMLARAKEVGARSVVYTFSNHPKSVFSPEIEPMLLMSPEKKVEAIKKLGVDEVIIEEFTHETAQTRAEAYIENLKTKYPRLDCVFCGGNWRFGKGGEGDAKLLRSSGIKVEEIDYACFDGDIVSSTRIRRTLAEGNLELVNKMLDREYSLEGIVVQGKGLGKKMGFPTINLEIPFPPPLKKGVYVLSTPCGKALANWGTAPTMKELSWKSPVLEMHILNCNCTIQPSTKIEVGFLKFIRPEKKFDSVEELKVQIEKDVATALMI
jgi:riboflavin kinase/FMN adenylyltransferase